MNACFTYRYISRALTVQEHQHSYIEVLVDLAKSSSKYGYSIIHNKKENVFRL